MIEIGTEGRAESFINISKLAIIKTTKMLNLHRELKLINAYTESDEKVIQPQ